MTTPRTHPDERKNVAPPPPRSHLYAAAAVCAAVALLTGVADHFLSQLPATNEPRRVVITAVDTWSMPIITACSLAAVVLFVAGRIARNRQLWSHQIRTTVAYHLQVRADALTCRRLRHRRRWIRSGQVRYQRHVALPKDWEKAVTAALTPLSEGPVTVTHTPKRRTISWGLAPPMTDTAPRWWEADEQPGSALTTGVFNNLEDLLKGLDVVRQETRLSDDPNDLTITLSYAQTTKDISPNFKARVRRILENKVPSPTGAWNLVWHAQKNQLTVKPGLPMPEKVHIPDSLPPGHTLPRYGLPFGVRVGGAPAVWNPARFPHFLVAGPTGGGKSSFIRTVLVMALLRMWDVYLADPKRLSYRRGFATGWGLSHDRIATRDDAIEAMVLAVSREVLRRYRLCEWDPNTEPHHFAPTLLIIDENTEALPAMHRAAAARWMADPESKGSRPPKSEAPDALWSIARLGRQVGVFLVLAHQRPDVRYIPGESRDNFMSVYATGELSDEGLRMLFNEYGIEQRIYKPEEGPDGELTHVAVAGRGTAQVGNGIEPVQGWWTPDPASEEDCPPGSDSAKIMQRLAQQCLAAQTQANHPLLDGIITIDPEQEAELAQQEMLVRQQFPELSATRWLYQQFPQFAEDSDTAATDMDRPDSPEDDSSTSSGATGEAVTPPVAPPGATGAPVTPAGHQPQAPGGANGGDQGKQDDEKQLRWLAVEQVLASQHGSTSMLQRKLRVGWHKANILMEELERLGVVGAAAGTQAREVRLGPDTDVAAVLQGEFVGADELDDEEDDPADEPQARYEEISVEDLFEGDLVMLDLGTGPVEVEIDAYPCESPHDPDRVEVECRIVDPNHPETGERQLTELAVQDLVRRRLDSGAT